MSVIVSAIVALVAGAIGSLVAPWVNWGVEKRRQRFERRKEMVESWRQLLRDVSEFTVVENEDVRYAPLIGLLSAHAAYFSLQPHLSQETRDAIEATRRRFWGCEHVQIAFDLLVRDINRIERDWDLA